MRSMIHFMPPTRRQPVPHAGFTLIEVMIVVAVIGILGAIALPSYNEYIRRGHRADARAGLLQAQLWMERGATAMGVYPTALPASLTWANDSARRYTLSLGQGSDANGFTLLATPRGPQASDKCGTLTLTHQGERGMSGAAKGLHPQDCWNK